MYIYIFFQAAFEELLAEFHLSEEGIQESAIAAEQSRDSVEQKSIRDIYLDVMKPLQFGEFSWFSMVPVRNCCTRHFWVHKTLICEALVTVN